MQQLRTGELLRRFRIEKEVSEEKLGYGVCSGTAISNYEIGSREMDTVLLEFLLERMGVSPENFAFMLSEEEYSYYMWKAAVYEAVEETEWEALEELLLKRDTSFFVGNEKIQIQFYMYMKAILEAEKYSNYVVATEHLSHAIKITIGDIYHISLDNKILSVGELHMIILYLHYSLCAGIIEYYIAKQLFCEIEKYILSSYMDIKEKSKIYPKLICIWINHQGDISEVEKIHMCEKAIRILKEGLQFNDIIEVLKIYLSLLDENSHKFIFYKKQYEALEGIFAYAEIEEQFRPEYVIRKIPKIYVITEYLKYKRKELKMTQNKVSEGICEPETYSRIERGKRTPSPTKRKALMERLNIGWHYFRGELDTDSLEVYKLKSKHRVAKIKENWQESYEILEELEKLLDMDSVNNLQYVSYQKSDALYHLGRLSEDEYYEILLKMLKLTVDVGYKELVYYSQTELEIIGDIAKNLRKKDKVGEAIEFLESILKQMKKSKIEFVYRWDGVEYIQRILGGLYFEKKEYMQSYETESQVYRMAIHERDSGNLPTLLDDMADDLEHIGEQYRDEYTKLYRLTYYVSDLYEINHIRDFTKKYYEKFEEEYNWY